jgi:phosphate transport system permease protein
MPVSSFFFILLLFSLSTSWFGIKKARSLEKKAKKRLYALAKYHGYFLGLLTFIAGLFAFIALKLTNIPLPFAMSQTLAALGFSFIAGLVNFSRLRLDFPAREKTEKIIKFILLICASIVVWITFSIVLSLIFEAVRFYKIVPLQDFLFGMRWKPEVLYSPTEVAAAKNHFGAVPIFVGTLLITTIAMVIALPVGLFIAVYTSEYASSQVRLFLKPTVEILAGIPTIVYGFFAIIAIAPLLRSISNFTNLSISSESALGTGIVMGLMIIPFISSLVDDALRAVPKAFRDSSLAMGATVSETIKKVVLPSALPSILAATLLAISRAIGETMLVVMAAGLNARLTFNPLDSVTTVTVQIVYLLTGDQEFNNPKTLSAFALGLTLFVITLILNIVALKAVKHHQKKYGT